MSWLRRNAEIPHEDLETFSFEPRESRVFTIERQDEERDATQEFLLKTDEEWEKWLEMDFLPHKRKATTRINLVLGSRAQRNWGHDPSIVSKLPWSQSAFLHIQKKLFMHSSIVRTINRSTSCMFSRIQFDWKKDQSIERSLVYNCRTDATWPGDMAMSVTFFLDSLTTHAVLFGCDFKTPDMYDEEMTLPDIILSRLSKSDLLVFHPMLLPTIFADIERDRQIEMVRAKLPVLGERIDWLATATVEKSDLNKKMTETSLAATNITDDGYNNRKLSSNTNFLLESRKERVPIAGSTLKPISQSPPKKPEKTNVELWLEISHIRTGLETWQRQLNKMIAHVEELSATEFKWKRSRRGKTPHNKARLQQLDDAGARIIERLKELVDEYSEYISECTHIMNGMSLATQLELSHISRGDAKTNLNISKVNLDVARMTRQDGSLMKSIAVLGMFFLPATFVTTFFSMDFFDWSADGVKMGISKYVWVYIVAVVVLTLLTVGLFYIFVLRRRTFDRNEATKRPHLQV